jgi:hypothetical protein
MKLVIDSKVCPETDAKEWAKIILYAHTKGYLYMTPDQETIVCAYRSDSETHSDEMPMNEHGRHLHVVWAASNSKDKLGLLKLLKSYIKFNEVDDITYYRRNSETDFKRIKVNHE